MTPTFLPQPFGSYLYVTDYTAGVRSVKRPMFRETVLRFDALYVSWGHTQ